jgi:hypothetical protein
LRLRQGHWQTVDRSIADCRRGDRIDERRHIRTEKTTSPHRTVPTMHLIEGGQIPLANWARRHLPKGRTDLECQLSRSVLAHRTVAGLGAH